jgi:hypothetical protein
MVDEPVTSHRLNPATRRELLVALSVTGLVLALVLAILGLVAHGPSLARVVLDVVLIAVPLGLLRTLRRPSHGVDRRSWKGLRRE